MKKRIFMALVLGAFLIPATFVQAVKEENISYTEYLLNLELEERKLEREQAEVLLSQIMAECSKVEAEINSQN